MNRIDAGYKKVESEKFHQPGYILKVLFSGIGAVVVPEMYQ